jgi:hypothetical protein
VSIKPASHADGPRAHTLCLNLGIVCLNRTQLDKVLWILYNPVFPRRRNGSPVSRSDAVLHIPGGAATGPSDANPKMISKIREAVRSLPQQTRKAAHQSHAVRRTDLRTSDRQMRLRETTVVLLEEKLRSCEEEIVRLRVENEQLRQSSKAFGELAERLSIALKTATRVDRKSTAADTGGPRRRSVLES